MNPTTICKTSSPLIWSRGGARDSSTPSPSPSPEITEAERSLPSEPPSGIALFQSLDAFSLTKEEQKAFVDLNAIKEIPWEEQLEIIKNLYAQRMKTTYFVNYCEKLAKKTPESETAGEVDGDTLLSTSDKVYSLKTQKLLQPVPTSRRVMGYCRPAYYYMGLTEYQDEYGKLGYQRLLPTKGERLKQRLTFCDKFPSKN